MLKRKIRIRRQRGGFLNGYDFAYAGWDTLSTGLNTFKRIAPGLTKNGGNKIDKVNEERIAQLIRQGGNELKRVAPIILKKVIKQLYKTSLCLLRKNSRRKINSALKKLKYEGKSSFEG